MEINRIYCMDCVDGMRQLPGGFVDLTVTSPPYDNLRTYHGFHFDFPEVAKELYRVTKDGGVVVWIVNDATVKGSETGTSFRQALGFMDAGFNLHDTMIWIKAGGGAVGSSLCYTQSTEYMFVLSKGKPKTVNLIVDRENVTAGSPPRKGGRRRQTGEVKEKRIMPHSVPLYSKRYNWWYYPNYRGYGNHPATFPEPLARDHILSWSAPGDLVLDPFMGSGTTAKMARDNGRNYIGFDVSEEYCEIACERLKLEE